jgi:hypothetical protein
VPEDPSQVPIMPFDPNWVVLGLVCFLLAGIFMMTSVGRGRPHTRAQFVLGMSPESLSSLRASVMAKGRSMCAAIFFLVGTAMLLSGVLVPGEKNPTLQFWGSAGLFALGGALLYLLDGHVKRVMRNHLRKQLTQHPFAFEEHLVLTREIGTLFGVEASQGETLENYIRSVCQAIDIPANGPGAGRNLRM